MACGDAQGPGVVAAGGPQLEGQCLDTLGQRGERRDDLRPQVVPSGLGTGPPLPQLADLPLQADERRRRPRIEGLDGAETGRLLEPG